MTIKRRNLIATSALSIATATTLFPRQVLAADDRDSENAKLPSNIVYIESNNAAIGQNSILAYRRAANGSLTPLPGSPFLTGGRGFYVKKFPGPFDSDSEIVLDRRRGILYAVNSGSSSVAALTIRPDGSLSPVAYSPFAIPGTNPISLGLHDEHLLVLNADADPAQHIAGRHPNLVLTKILGQTGGVTPVPFGAVNLPDNSQPTQVLTTNTGRFIFTCEFFGGTVRSFVVDDERTLRQVDVQTPPIQPGSTKPPLPLGLWAHDRAPILYVAFVTAGLLGVYRWDQTGRLTFLRAAPTAGAAICWLRTAFRGSRLYSMNTGDNSISVFDTSKPEQPKEIQHLVIGGLGGIVQFEVSPDQRFLYIIEQLNKPDNPAAVAQGNRIRVATIDPATGLVAELPAATLRIDVPANTIPQGVVVL